MQTSIVMWLSQCNMGTRLLAGHLCNKFAPRQFKPELPIEVKHLYHQTTREELHLRHVLADVVRGEVEGLEDYGRKISLSSLLSVRPLMRMHTPDISHEL